MTSARPPEIAFERGVALEHADRVVRAQHGDRRAEVDPRRARGDRGEHHVAGRHREVVGVVLADAEEVDADLVGEDALLDDVADRLGVRQRAAVGVVGDVAERVEPEDEGNGRCRSCGHVRSSASRRLRRDRPLELGRRQRRAEHRAARLQHPARAQAVQPDRVVADPVDEVRDDVDRGRVVARDAERAPVRRAGRPALGPRARGSRCG